MKAIWIFIVTIALLSVGFVGIGYYFGVSGYAKWIGITVYLLLIHLPAYEWWIKYFKKTFDK